MKRKHNDVDEMKQLIGGGLRWPGRQSVFHLTAIIDSVSSRNGNANIQARHGRSLSWARGGAKPPTSTGKSKMFSENNKCYAVDA